MITSSQSDPGTSLTSAPPRFALTVVVCAVTVVTSVAALFIPALMDLFTRDLMRLQAGQWWRAFTPVLVQSSGWGQLAFNLLGLAVVGVALEQRVSRPCWAMVFLLGGPGSIAVLSAWTPGLSGAGSSDAVAALLGAFIVFPVISGRRLGSEWPAQLYAVFFAAYLTTMDLAGLNASIIVGNASIIAFFVARRALHTVVLSRACLVVVAGGGVLMTVAQDGHGTGILAGLATASLILIRRWLLERYDGSRVAHALLAVASVWVLAWVAWLAWVRLLGVDLVVAGNPGRIEVGLASVSVVAIGSCLLAWLVLWLLQRWWPRAGARVWVGLCTVVAAASLGGPLLLGVGSTSKAALVFLHLTGWAGTVALLAPSTETDADPPGDVADVAIHGSSHGGAAAVSG